MAQKAENKVVSANSEFSPEEQRVLEILKDGGIYSMEEISSLSNLPPRIVSSTLTLPKSICKFLSIWMEDTNPINLFYYESNFWCSEFCLHLNNVCLI